MTEAETLSQKCMELEKKLDGKWFALKDGKLIAVANTNEELRSELRKLDVRKLLIGYAPTKEEKEAECLYKIFY